MSKTLKNGLAVGILALIAVCVATVPAEDVIVKEGSIGTGSVSPDSRAKVFITDTGGPANIYYADCYGLLSMTTDPDDGSENMCGMLCEFFSDASAGLGASAAGWLFNYPVGTQSDSAYYYSLYADTAGASSYSTDGQTVDLVGVCASANNYGDVSVSGGVYSTTGLSAHAQPVASGLDLAASFKNYGIDVSATLAGNCNDSSGGENFGIKIVTSEQLTIVPPGGSGEINSYALWLEPFTSSNYLRGGETYGIYQEGSGVMNYFEGDISADDVTDRTPGYDGTVQDALSEIVNTRSIDGQIDHSSLPALARATLKRVEKTNRRIVEYTDPSGRIVEREEYDIHIVEEEGRSLGGMITVLTEAVKGLNEKFEALEAQSQILKAQIAELKAQ